MKRNVGFVSVRTKNGIYHFKIIYSPNIKKNCLPVYLKNQHAIINLFFKSRNCWWFWKKKSFFVCFFLPFLGIFNADVASLFLAKISFQSRRSLRASLNWLYLSCLIMFLPFLQFHHIAERSVWYFPFGHFFFFCMFKN